jgi:hypothetical protein
MTVTGHFHVPIIVSVMTVGRRGRQKWRTGNVLGFLRQDVVRYQTWILGLGNVSLLSQTLHALAIVASALLAHDLEPGEIMHPEIDKDFNASIIGNRPSIMPKQSIPRHVRLRGT